MCLNTKQRVPRTAKQDIKVYKILGIERVQPLKTVYTKEGKITQASDFRLIPNQYRKKEKVYRLGYLNKISKLGIRRGEVTVGFHSFVNLSDATKESGGSRALVECKIPKGSLYFQGTNNGTSEGYCSDKIVIVKIL